MRFFRTDEAYFASPYTPSVEGWTSMNSSKSWTEKCFFIRNAI